WSKRIVESVVPRTRRSECARAEPGDAVVEIPGELNAPRRRLSESEDVWTGAAPRDVLGRVGIDHQVVRVHAGDRLAEGDADRGEGADRVARSRRDDRDGGSAEAVDSQREGECQKGLHEQTNRGNDGKTHWAGISGGTTIYASN